MTIKIGFFGYWDILQRANQYREAIKTAPIYEKLKLDKVLETGIEQALSDGNLNAVVELCQLRRPLAVGKLEGARMAKAGRLSDDDLASNVKTAIDSHADKFWGGWVG